MTSGAKIPWAQLRSRYVMEETLSYQDLASEFGVALSTVSSRGTRERWPDERRRYIEEHVEHLKGRARRAYADQAVRFANTYMAELLQTATAILKRQRLEANDTENVERTKLDARIVIPILQAADRISASMMPTLVAAAAAGARMTLDASAISGEAKEIEPTDSELPMSPSELRALSLAALAGAKSGALPDAEDLAGESDKE